MISKFLKGAIGKWYFPRYQFMVNFVCIYYVRGWLYKHSCYTYGKSSPSIMWTRGWLSIKMASYQYRDSHYKDKTVSRPSYLYYVDSHTYKMIFILECGPVLHWPEPLLIRPSRTQHPPIHSKQKPITAFQRSVSKTRPAVRELSYTYVG